MMLDSRVCHLKGLDYIPGCGGRTMVGLLPRCKGRTRQHNRPGSAELSCISFFFLTWVARLQREEEEAYASSQQTHGAQSLTFSKFEEKKTNEKSRKVTTVKKFFGASSRAGAKKGKREAPALTTGAQEGFGFQSRSPGFLTLLLHKHLF